MKVAVIGAAGHVGFPFMQPMFVKGTNRFMNLDRLLNWFETNVFTKE